MIILIIIIIIIMSIIIINIMIMIIMIIMIKILKFTDSEVTFFARHAVCIVYAHRQCLWGPYTVSYECQFM